MFIILIILTIIAILVLIPLGIKLITENENKKPLVRTIKILVLLISTILSVFALIGTIGFFLAALRGFTSYDIVAINQNTLRFTIAGLLSPFAWVSFYYLGVKWVLDKKINKNLLILNSLVPAYPFIALFPISLFAVPVVILQAYMLFKTYTRTTQLGSSVSLQQ